VAVREIPVAELEVPLEAGADLGEGPLWDDREQALWWVDIMDATVHRFDPAKGTDEPIPVGQPVGAVALRERGGLVLALQQGFATLDGTSVRHLAAVEADNAETRMNDGYVDPQGRFWAGTMGMAERKRVGSLYRLDADGSVSRHIRDVGVSNGIDWSPDGRTVYYADTLTRTLDVFDFDGERGTLSNRRRLLDFPRGGGSADGLVVDAEGYLWIAMWGGWAVHRYTPEGELDTVVHVPAEQVTKPAFAGPDRGDLYITTARQGLTPERLGEQPHAGHLFRVQPGATGQPVRRFPG
jgi:sugar lactone lactonase YvrE